LEAFIMLHTGQLDL